MNVSDFKTSAEIKLKKLDELLEQMFGIRIDWESPEEYLETVLSHYTDRRAIALAENALVNNSPEYTKTVLITEALRIYLREIAPVRQKKKRRTT